ncbi:Low temperature viability protein [Aspergillus egyptiacus]|nr:Low temperature viability protein [Aspergillus egyptiacus]
MPPRKQWIDKKNATTYQLFHRSQNDPLIHDPEADDRVLHAVHGPPQNAPNTSATKRSKTLNELASEFGSAVRSNEGEAANYGVFFDDSKYDYMQHLRDLGAGVGDSHFIEATSKGKGKGKSLKLEDALASASLDDEDTRSNWDGRSTMGSAYGAYSTASTYSRKPTYQDQQDIPDAIAGFQPDMDPRLREVLEALEDEEYVDEKEDDDFFGQLTRDGEEVDPGDWEDTLFDHDEEDDGWESDATEKAPVQPSTTSLKQETTSDAAPPAPGELPSHDAPAPDMNPEDQDWMREFAKFKKAGKTQPTPAAPASVVPSEQRSTLASTVFTVGGTPIRRKKRKGALTNPSAYSMTSSSLARTEGHRLLDDRFDRVEAMYALEEEDEYDDSMSMVSGMTGMTDLSTASSQAPSLIDANGNAVAPRHDFNNIMDDFLAGWDDKTSAQAKRKGAKAKRGKNGNEAIGIRMLDEVRQGLGPARIPGRVPGRA